LSYGIDAPLLIAVTVLTSMDQQQLSSVGVAGTLEEQVLRLAMLSKESGLDGVVCSAKEVSLLRATIPDDFCLVTPGIRPAGSELGDQIRVMTPPEALAAGSSYLVIGRPITGAADPKAALASIHDSI